MRMVRRQFSLYAAGGAAALAGMSAFGRVGGQYAAAQAARYHRLNILCWEGYNADTVLGPFREDHPGAVTHAETGTSDPDMIARLRTEGPDAWDLINVNQPWARDVLYPEGLIRPLSEDRFMPYFERMLPAFAGPYPPAVADDGSLLGMPQRYGPFSFVVNTDRVSRAMAEDEGWSLFLDAGMAGRYGVLAFENWNIMHLCLTAGLDPFSAVDGEGEARFAATARRIFAGAGLVSGDIDALNAALIGGEIDAYFTGGTYTVSPARFAGAGNVRAITPNEGPVDGKGGIVWVELTSAVNAPESSPLAEDFLEFVQQPEICKAVAFAEGTYNPVSQMGDPAVLSRFDTADLDALQWDTIDRDTTSR